MPDQQTNSNQITKTDTPPLPVPDDTPFCLTFDVPPSLSNIMHLRRTARCLLESLGLSRDNTDDVETLIGELCTNVVRHAHIENTNYRVSLEFPEDRVVVTVVDHGVGFVEDAILPPGALRPDGFSDDVEERIGGLGLPLIHALADHVEIRPTSPHGTTVRAEKSIRPGS